MRTRKKAKVIRISIPGKPGEPLTLPPGMAKSKTKVSVREVSPRGKVTFRPAKELNSRQSRESDASKELRKFVKRLKKQGVM